MRYLAPLGAFFINLVISGFVQGASQNPNETAPLILRLWSGPAPLAHGTKPVDIPTLSAYLSPGTGIHPAVVIFPGGGYGYLSLHFEGETIARWFQARGISAFVVRYRLGEDGYHYPVPFLDAQRAVRLVRSRSTEWHLEPDHIGVIGFSAGGHLAGLIATDSNAGAKAPGDPVDQISDRPDFAILLYPVITMEQTNPEPRSRQNLLGPNPDPALAAELSIDHRVTSRMPPTLLMYSRNDPIVPPGFNGDVMAAALARAQVPNEVVVFPDGGHGWGLGHQPERGPAHWLDKLESWLKRQNL
jgi:acetyl esterase/lipase